MNVAALGARPGRSCSPESSLSEAAVRLRNAPGGLLAVADHGKFLGILTDQDVVRALAQAGASAGGMPVRIFLQSSVPVCRPSDEVRDALRILRTRKVLVFKKKRTKQYRRTKGHRQTMIQVRIEAIEG